VVEQCDVEQAPGGNCLGAQLADSHDVPVCASPVLPAAVGGRLPKEAGVPAHDQAWLPGRRQSAGPSWMDASICSSWARS
jgi:hypothetical protein